MYGLRLLVFAAVGCAQLIAGGSATAQNSVSMDWSNLIDETAQIYEDPFRDLTNEQIYDLRVIVGLRAKKSQEPLRSEDTSRLADAEERLDGTGVDADWLISQRWVVAENRERAGTAGNPAIDGATVQLGGFAIPAPAAADGTPTAYLVPEPGMCSHVPPPPPNQLVRLKLNGGWSPTMMHEPVLVTGVLRIDPSERAVVVVDGDVPMRSTFTLDVAEVQSFGSAAQTQASGVTSNSWASNLVGLARDNNSQSANQ